MGARLNNHSEYGSHFVYNVNPSFAFKTDRLFKSYEHLCHFLYYTFLDPVIWNFGANPYLEPEDNRTIEGGLEYAMNDKLRVSAVYFNRKEENFVFFDNTIRNIF